MTAFGEVPICGACKKPMVFGPTHLLHADTLQPECGTNTMADYDEFMSSRPLLQNYSEICKEACAEIARLRSVNADLQAVLEAQQKLVDRSASWQQAAESAGRFAFVLKNALIELVETYMCLAISSRMPVPNDLTRKCATARDLFDKSALDFSSREAVEEWARKHPAFKSP